MEISKQHIKYDTVKSILLIWTIKAQVKSEIMFICSVETAKSTDKQY